MADGTGERFARALAAKDGAALTGLLGDPVDFQALTPRRHWQAATPGEVVDDIMLGQWFEPQKEIVRLESVSTSGLPGREHVSYRLRVRSGSEEFLVEQQAYFEAGADARRIRRRRRRADHLAADPVLGFPPGRQRACQPG